MKWRNRHIKIVNGRRYWYESTREGDKIISRYLEPVDKRVKRRKE